MKIPLLKMLSIIFPETCVICTKGNTSLCDTCIESFEKSPFITETWIHVLFSYRDKNVRRLIHSLKFKHVKSISDKLAPLLHEAIIDTQMNILSLKQQRITLLPIPNLKSHANKRGSNTTLNLCKSIANQDLAKYVVDQNSIIRVNTKAQVGLSRNERLTNMNNAFQLTTKNSLSGKTIFIIDDVMTTGSTLRELRKTCVLAGAKEVYAIVIAH